LSKTSKTGGSLTSEVTETVPVVKRFDDVANDTAMLCSEELVLVINVFASLLEHLL